MGKWLLTRIKLEYESLNILGISIHEILAEKQYNIHHSVKYRTEQKRTVYCFIVSVFKLQKSLENIYYRMIVFLSQASIFGYFILFSKSKIHSKQSQISCCSAKDYNVTMRCDK